MQIDYTAHAAQREIHAARDARFRTVCTGRRFGKTRCMAAEILYCGGIRKGGDYGWVAPTYGVAERGVEAFRTIAADSVRVVGHMPTRVEFAFNAGPCRVWFLSADNPDSIRGFGFNGIVVDEAAVVPVDVWNYALRPTLAQTLGWAVFISTPAGRNWFYDMFTRGVEKQEGFKSFTFGSNMSPYFPAKEWEEAKATLPEDVFRQEYMAEFLEDSAGVFRGVSGCLVPHDPAFVARLRVSGDRVVIGVDVAKHSDWTVCVALDPATGRCLEMERFNMLDWPVQRARITGFVRSWGPEARLVMDATGVGDPIYDDLSRELPSIEPFRFTAPSKRELVQGLMVAVEKRAVTWPGGDGGLRTEAGGQRSRGDWEVLTAEMKRYEYRVGPMGQVSYDAPSGYHDDCVMALALAWYGVGKVGRPVGSMHRIGRGRERALMLV